jgi:hypothetical protein
VESFFYSELNVVLRKDSAEYLPILGPLIRTMMRGPSYGPFSGTVFRGFKCETSEFQNYAPGLVFSWPAFTSCSKDHQVAEAFTKKGGLIFQITIPTELKTIATDISQISYFRGEAEVLVNPYTCFLVNDVMDHVVHCTVVSGKQQLTGIWDCVEDKGIYYITQTGSTVVWFGYSAPSSGYSWSHVFIGKIEGLTFKGTFADVPVNQDRYTGEIVCQIGNDLSTIVRTSSGVFMGKTWQKRRSYLIAEDCPKLSYYRKSSDTSISGRWKSDKGIIYYMITYGNKVYWLAYAENWTVANVGQGTQQSPTTWTVQYSDIVLSERFRFFGSISIQLSGNSISITKVNGPYACTKLNRFE